MTVRIDTDQCKIRVGTCSPAARVDAGEQVPLGYGVGQDCWDLPSQLGILRLHSWHHNPSQHALIHFANSVVSSQ